MFRTAFAAGVFALALAGPAGADPSHHLTQSAAARDPSAHDLSAQVRRAPPRLRVNPGRLLYRDCDFRLVQQWRPSGPVIVPWQRCWWVRG
jgi:hypothetical protein